MESLLRTFKALADATRLRIMLLLLERELCVCELESVLGMEQSRISHALRALHDAGLIEERREGRWVFYKASASLPPSLRAGLEESARHNGQALDDRKSAARLLESHKPTGRRCPLRNG